MPPRTRKGQQGAHVVYHSAPAVKQKRFPHQRCSATANRGNLAASLTKAQSTLTQMEFVSSPTSRTVEDSEEDKTYEQEQPSRKKQRTQKPRSRTQRNTLTQMDFVPSASRLEEMDDADDVAIWEDGMPDADAVLETAKQRAAARAEALPWLRQRSHEPGKENVRPASSAVKLFEQHGLLADAQEFLGHVLKTDQKTDAQPTTPSRVRLREVPSSQTPTDAKLSPQGGLRTPAGSRSLLRGRRVDAIAELTSPMRTKTPTPAAALSRHDFSQCTADSTLNGDNDNIPRLKHRSTIQDSEDASETDDPPMRVRKLMWQNTVQDSQREDLDFGSGIELEDDNVGDSGIEAEFHSNDDRQEDFDGCDPAFSALDRDASRYMQTQWTIDETGGAESQNAVETQPLNQSAKPDGPELTLSPGGDDQEIAIPSSQPAEPSTEKQHHRTEEALELTKSLHNGTTSSGITDSCAHSVKPAPQPSTTTKMDPGQCVPSSSPPLPPSQVSTADFTQPSPRSLPQPTPPHTKSLLHAETLSSSPFALPPWTSPERHRFGIDSRPVSRDGNGMSVGLQGLVDFSLPPPPPPVSSWRSSGGVRLRSPRL